MVSDHTAAGNELAALAQLKQMTPPDEMDLLGLAGAAPTTGEGDLAFQSENTISINE